MTVKTADQWRRDLKNKAARDARIERAKKNAPKVSIEDLRDECVTIARQSGLTYEEIHARHGASPGTLTKWLHRETLRPQLNTIRGTLQACGYDLVIAPRADSDQMVQRRSPAKKK